MPEELTPHSLMRQLIDGMVDYARCSERLRATIAALGPVSTAIADLQKIDPELAPELAVAEDHLGEALAAIARAFDFQNARYEVMIQRVFDKAKEAGGG